MPELTISRMRDLTPRGYGFISFEKEFFATARFPRDTMMDVTNDDLKNLKKALVRFDTNELRRKLTNVHLFTDSHHMEVGIDQFFEVILQGTHLGLKKLFRDSQAPDIGADPMIRRILDEIAEDAGKKMMDRFGKGGGKMAAGYGIGGRGRPVGYAVPEEGKAIKDIAVLPTIRAAASRAHAEGRGRAGIEVKPGDLRVRIRRAKMPNFLALVVDIGSSLDEEMKIRCVLPTVRSVLQAAYERRDQVSVITASGNKGMLLVNFTTDVEHASMKLRAIKFGGLSPLASGIITGFQYLMKKVGDRGAAIPILVILTDGTANVPLYPGGHVRRELDRIFAHVSKSKANVLVVDTSVEGSHAVREISLRCGGRYYHPPFIRFIEKMKSSKDLLKSFAVGDKEALMKQSKDFLKKIG